MTNEPFIVGSQDTLKGFVRDRVGGVLELKDLTGATVALKVRINKGALKTWTCTPHVDQIGHRGEFSYDLVGGGTPDIDKAGDVMLQLHLTISAKTHVSKAVNLTAEASVALSAAA
jgi:hypothetical protein